MLREKRKRKIFEFINWENDELIKNINYIKKLINFFYIILMEDNQYLKLKKVYPLNTSNNNFYKKNYTVKSRNKNVVKVMKRDIKERTIINKIALGLSLTARARTKV
jgi:hypothetical protein